MIAAVGLSTPSFPCHIIMIPFLVGHLRSTLLATLNTGYSIVDYNH